MRWEVLADDAVSVWLGNLGATDPKTFELVTAAIDKLEDDGPTLGRPMVDRIAGSKYQNMKELRPGSSRSSEIRILFAFDLHRRAILLAAGDKSGDWTQWYDDNIPVADDRFTQHQASLRMGDR